jgi:hypothetical protein
MRDQLLPSRKFKAGGQVRFAWTRARWGQGVKMKKAVGLAVVISMKVAAISGCALACGPIAVNGLTLLNSPDGVSTP